MLYYPPENRNIKVPPLTSDDQFNSNPDGGAKTIALRLPSLPELFGMPQTSFDSLNEIVFYLKVTNGEGKVLECEVSSKCKVSYRKMYTPVIFRINPPVIYKGLDVEIWYDPKSVMSKIENLNSDDLPFVNAKFGSAHVDFEYKVTSETSISSWRMNRVHGSVTDQPNSLKTKFNMLWEVGNSLKQEVEMKTCNFNQSDCYETKTVPVIHSISHAEGYTSGGQNLVINGYGFDNATLSIIVAGVKCIPTLIKKDYVNCTTGQASSPSVTTP
jgi:hypothetical protein